VTKRSQFLPWLKRFWVLMVAAPLLTFIQRGSGSRFITAVALYLAGWLLLRVALVRDPVAKGLESFVQSKFPRVLGASVVLSLVALVALGMTVDGVLDFILTLSVGLFAIWAAMLLDYGCPAPRPIHLYVTLGKRLREPDSGSSPCAL